MGTLRVPTAFNIREWDGRRKQKPVRGPESRSKRFRDLFGILGRLERPRGLEGRYWLADLRLNMPGHLAHPERQDGHLRTMGVAVRLVSSPCSPLS